MFGKKRPGSTFSDEVAITTIPVSCAPGGENEDTYRAAFADYLSADTPEDAETAMAQMRDLGVETAVGRVALD